MKTRLNVPTRRIANLFGAVGYTLLSIVYVVVVGGVVMWLVQHDTLSFIGVHPVKPIELVPTEVIPEAPKTAPILVQLIQLFFASVLLIAVIFVVVSLPYWLGRSSSRLLKRMIRLLKYPVTLRSLLFAKLIACGLATIPALILVIYDMKQLPLVITELAVVTIAAIIFLVQHHLAENSEVMEAKDTW